MTAINVFKTGQAWHVISDGAIYGADGTVKVLAEKQILFPSVPGVLAALGNNQLTAYIAELVRMAGADLDGIVGRGPNFQSGAELIKRQIPSIGADILKFELHFVGWSSARKRLEHWIMPSHDYPTSAGMKLGQFNLNEDPFGAVNPPPSEEAMRATGFDLACLEDFDPTKDGIQLIEAQRRTKSKLGFVGIGGFVQHTIVTPLSITSQIIHRWPDKVGELISVGSISTR